MGSIFSGSSPVAGSDFSKTGNPIYDNVFRPILNFLAALVETELPPKSYSVITIPSAPDTFGPSGIASSALISKRVDLWLLTSNNAYVRFSVDGSQFGDTMQLLAPGTFSFPGRFKAVQVRNFITGSPANVQAIFWT